MLLPLFNLIVDEASLFQGCHFTWKNLEFSNLGKKKQPGKT